MTRSLILHDVANKIYVLRACRVLLSTDLAELYGVEVRALVQAVKRNIERFPADFMFQLSDKEQANLKSHSVISSWGGARRSAPYAFTQEGVAMLSSVLRSPLAVQTNIALMRAFVLQRDLLLSHQTRNRKIEQLENKYDHNFKIVFDAIREIVAPRPKARKSIGFKNE